MEKSHAHHLLLQLIKKSGQQRHYEALNSLYTINQEDAFTMENLPDDFQLHDILYRKGLSGDYTCTTKTNWGIEIDIDIILSTANRFPDDLLVLNSEGTYIPFVRKDLTK